MKDVINHFHLFCGLGGGAKGFNAANPRVGNRQGAFKCLGGIDVDATAIANFERLSGTPGTVLDLFDRDQYQAYHGVEPPPVWREATTADMHAAAGNERPHVVFLSAPCKGFSGLLSSKKSSTAKYQALNRLTLRGIWLMLEAWKDDPVELVVFENVPRIANRGRPLLDQICKLLRSYGYAVAETTHDCGELGGLAQSRKRFLLVARHREKVPAFLYEPPKRPLRAVGEVLDKLPLPGDQLAGPMHRIPSLQWKTWVRLAFIKAGSDWRSLLDLKVEDGKLADYLIVPEYHHGYLGVLDWTETCGVIASRSTPSNGKFSVADPRYQGAEYAQYGVVRYEENMGAITSQRSPGQGRFSVADPRYQSFGEHAGKMRVEGFDEPAHTVTCSDRVGSGAMSVADPRPVGSAFKGKYKIVEWEKHAGSVISGSTTGQGAFAVADPRSKNPKKKGDAYLTCGHYGVNLWQDPAWSVTARAKHDTGRFSVGDPRLQDLEIEALPDERKNLVACIQSLDGTWHRPFTTLELAALQSLVDPEELFTLEGRSDQEWREQIGNAVPPAAATAIAEMMGQTLLLTWSGETFALGSTPIWVQPVAVALSVDIPEVIDG